jgi:chromosome segregation ATPase
MNWLKIITPFTFGLAMIIVLELALLAGIKLFGQDVGQFVLLLIGSMLTVIGMIIQHFLSLDTHRKNLITQRQFEVIAQVVSSYEDVKIACLDFLGAEEEDNSLNAELATYHRQREEISENIAAVQTEVQALMSDLQASLISSPNEFYNLATQVQAKYDELKSASGDLKNMKKQYQHIAGMKNEVVGQMKSANQQLSEFRKILAIAMLVLPDSLHHVLREITEATNRLSGAQRDEFLGEVRNLNERFESFASKVRDTLLD